MTSDGAMRGALGSTGTRTITIPSFRWLVRPESRTPSGPAGRSSAPGPTVVTRVGGFGGLRVTQRRPLGEEGLIRRLRDRA